MSWYAGTEVKISLTFTDEATGTATDPSTATLKYQLEGDATTLVTKSLADLTQDSTGIYHYDVDTTGFDAGRWVVDVVSTGAVAAANADSFVVLALPI